MVHGKCPKGNGGTGVLPRSPEFGPMLDLYFSKHCRPLVSAMVSARPFGILRPAQFVYGYHYISGRILGIFLICKVTRSQTPADNQKSTLRINVSYVHVYSVKGKEVFYA